MTFDKSGSKLNPNNLKGIFMISKFKNYMQVQSYSSAQASALLILRIVVGIAFMNHGWGKIQSPFGWMPPEAGVPGFFQFLAALSEFGGGIALIIGLLTRLGSLGLAFTMLVATMMHALVKGDPFISMTGASSYELPLVYFGIAFLIVTMGPGKFSLDKMIFGQRT